MDLNARVDVSCGRKDGRIDGRKTGRLYRTLLKQVRQKRYFNKLIDMMSNLKHESLTQRAYEGKRKLP